MRSNAFINTRIEIYLCVFMDETQFNRNTIDGNHSFHYWACENPQETTQHEFQYRVLIYVRFGIIDECFERESGISLIKYET